MPGLCIGTDVIVGFPGETDEQFNETEAYLRESCIDYFHVFSYSERAFARSKKLEGQVESYKISARSKVLRELSQRKRLVFHQEHVNHNVTVLVESIKHDKWTGLTDNYIRVCFQSDNDLKNQMVTTNILESRSQDVLATL